MKAEGAAHRETPAGTMADTPARPGIEHRDAEPSADALLDPGDQPDGIVVIGARREWNRGGGRDDGTSRPHLFISPRLRAPDLRGRPGASRADDSWGGRH